MNEAEMRFVAYLDDHGYCWEYEPDYARALALEHAPTTSPDFLVQRDGCSAICEVRQFETTRIRDALARAGGYMSTGPQVVYGALRSGMHEKAVQLAPFAGAGMPLVIVLANPLGADVVLDANHVTAAMFGNPSVRMAIDRATGGPPDGAEMSWALENYGVFRSPVVDDGDIVDWTNRHPHVSAVVVVHERLHSQDWREEILRKHRAADRSIEAATEAAFAGINEIEARIADGEEPQGSYRWTDVYELHSDGAVALQRDWFAGPRDERYGFADAGRYGPLG